MKPGEYSGRKTGHKKCPGCPQVYNNNAIPERCSACNTYIGGKYVAPLKKLGAILITACIVSVRQNETGHNVRTFVDMSEEKKVKRRLIIMRFLFKIDFNLKVILI